ncbi:hypothetical protein CDD81_7882 [Ophiocordyceps australis]|uniref:AMP-dependent synthetase/ligase domain-containing protein n=1 Tax=Ophiocordyceps australis TaxID=1399860 RepID=A0A2C5XBM4_9HYPO|nr:hypothetical protein CDD81_7882 [Ophiocordyceps australis]
MSSSALPRLPLFEAIAAHDPTAAAVVHSLSGRSFSYRGLLPDVRRARDRMRQARPVSDLAGERIAFLVENSYDYVVTLLAIIAARAIAVPLSPAFPVPELQYILDHSEASLLVSTPRFASKVQALLATQLSAPPRHLELPKHHGADTQHETVELQGTDAGDAALMLYTSGTTNRPKGVLLPQSVLTAQSRSLIEAWQYSPSDRLLHVLPLHHIHGVVNALLTPLFAGSSIEFLFPFIPDRVWDRLAAPFLPSNPARNGPKITFFTAVPTVYSRLMASHKFLAPTLQEAAREAISPQNMRLTISGSAALPTPVKAAWHTLSRGSILLERYGMTEVGMALSCGLDPADRVDASVGWPLPCVQARLVDSDCGAVISPDEATNGGPERAGEIQLRGPTIFREYWRNPDATAREFVSDPHGGPPWFKTGDVAVRRHVPSAGLNTSAQPWATGPLFFILGRQSADIIKSGGEKVSALEVERELLSLPIVSEAAVVAVPSGRWGHKVGAVIVLDQTVASTWSTRDMRRALAPRLANYKLPQVLRLVDRIPRNAMGKINKKQLVSTVFAQDASGDEA